MARRQPAGAQTRRRLIEAATHTLRAQGLAGLTLDAVAREARVSKGGLLHHFPAKDALIEALLRQLMEDFAALVGRYAAREPARPGRWLRAYIRASFDDDPLPLELIAMLLSSVAENGALLALIREDAARWRGRLSEDGIPPARATVLRQAADALWVERLIGVAPEDGATRASVLDEMLRLAEVGDA